MSSFITSHCVPYLSNLALCLCRKQPSVAFHCVPSLADYSACLRRSLRPIASHYVPSLADYSVCLRRRLHLIASHCVPSLADYSACLRKSLRPIASHLWPFSHRTPTMSKQVPTLELQNGCLCVIILTFMSQHVSTVSQHPRQQCECGQLFP